MTDSTIHSTFEALDQLQQVCFILDGQGHMMRTSRHFNQLILQKPQANTVNCIAPQLRSGYAIQDSILESFLKQWAQTEKQSESGLPCAVSTFELTLPIGAGQKLMAYVQDFNVDNFNRHNFNLQNLKEQNANEHNINANNITDESITTKQEIQHLVLLQPLAQSRQETVQDNSHFDCLTGLSNRWKLCAVEEKLEQTLSQEMISVAFVDLNDLKCVNDCFGHDVGDHYLKILSDLMRHYSRPEDALVRYGGDEFVGVYMGMSPKLLEQRIELIHRELQMRLANYLEAKVGLDLHKSNYIERLKGIQLGFAYGIERLRRGQTLSETIMRADAKMYAMKALKKR